MHCNTNEFSAGEEKVIGLIRDGTFSVDTEGRIWRHKTKLGDLPQKRRAETELLSGYLEIRIYDGRRECGKRMVHYAYAHRVVWSWFNDLRPIPNGMEINHKNGVKGDNRIENLEVVDRAGNMLHSVRVLGRYVPPANGENNGRAKLTWDDVEAIRARHLRGVSAKLIASEFGVHWGTIYDILSGRTWKVPG